MEKLGKASGPNKLNGFKWCNPQKKMQAAQDCSTRHYLQCSTQKTQWFESVAFLHENIDFNSSSPWAETILHANKTKREIAGCTLFSAWQVYGWVRRRAIGAREEGSQESTGDLPPPLCSAGRLTLPLPETGSVWQCYEAGSVIIWIWHLPNSAYWLQFTRTKANQCWGCSADGTCMSWCWTGPKIDVVSGVFKDGVNTVKMESPFWFWWHSKNGHIYCSSCFARKRSQFHPQVGWISR